ncbi:MAG: ABC transporter ATP-binding protein/permease, partial [Clostridia bacterium]|nr:ABC transporter ATP-binding protein/permease [Clostridia bacterium]
PVLQGLNLKIPQGTTLGIIGASGSGKSTLVQLLVKLMPLSDGDILIGGKSYKDISLSTLRANIGLILQESYIYTRTVGENIAVAAYCDTQEKIEEAAKCACVHENISGFANGYDTVVGERGVTLSGGQKQRVAIARTLMRETPYIIFDDSLSAVDSETDAAIRANLKEENAGATVIIISHRITTVMHADNIIVLEDGKIKESGTHNQLLEEDGLYKKIYDVQMSLPDELIGELKAEADNG